MAEYEAIIQVIALTAGVAWASGINLYAALLVLGLGGSTGYVSLPDSLAILENPLVIGAAGLMYCVEFFADKVPGVDSFWDTLHTFIRLPAGALLAAGAVGDMHAAVSVAAGIVGGGMAAATHGTKAGTRLLINTSPEPFSNWGASLTEDALVIAGLWSALNYPLFFLIGLILFFVGLVWVLPRIWGLIVSIFSSLGRLFGLRKEPDENAPKVHVEAPRRSLSNTEMIASLERLHRLKQEGALTEAEYEKQKTVILSAS